MYSVCLSRVGYSITEKFSIYKDDLHFTLDTLSEPHSLYIMFSMLNVDVCNLYTIMRKEIEIAF